MKWESATEFSNRMGVDDDTLQSLFCHLDCPIVPYRHSELSGRITAIVASKEMEDFIRSQTKEKE